MKKTTLLFAVLILFLASCKKNELGGKSTIQGKVTHHSKPIPNARVFVKFNATEFPGLDTTLYDVRIVSDSQAGYIIKCYKGDYYLFGYGYDSGISQVVTGGMPVHIRNHETINNDVAVTE